MDSVNEQILCLFWWLANLIYSVDAKDVTRVTMAWASQLHQDNRTPLLWSFVTSVLESLNAQTVNSINVVIIRFGWHHISVPPLCEVFFLLCLPQSLSLIRKSSISLFALCLIGSARRPAINQSESHPH